MASNRQRAIAARMKAAQRRSALRNEEKNQADRERAAYNAGYSKGRAMAPVQLSLPSDFVDSVIDGFKGHLAREAMMHATKQGADGIFCDAVRKVAEEILQVFRPGPVRRDDIRSFVKWNAEYDDRLEFGVDIPAMRVRMMQDTRRLAAYLDGYRPDDWPKVVEGKK